MRNPGSIIIDVLKNYWDEMFNLMLFNMLWLVAQLLIVPGPPATAALFYVANRAAKGGFVRLSDFVDAFKRYFWESWKWGALNILVILILGNALVFYASSQLQGPFSLSLAVVNLFLLVEWLFTQLFAFPFWLEQEKKQMRLAFRNAVIIQAQNLRLMMLAALLAVLLLVVSYYFPVLIALGVISFLMLLGNSIVVEKVKELQEDGEDSVQAR